MFWKQYPTETRIIKALFIVAFVALAIGGTFGLIQALHRTAYVDNLISPNQYYSILTGHGVLLALVFTTFFICGLFTWATTNSLEVSLRHPWFSWSWFGVMLTGVILATIPIIGGLTELIPLQAAVLYTFYAPLKASSLFYIGAALLIVGSWLAGLDWFMSYWHWRGDNPDQSIPLQTHMVLFTMLMWYVSSIGVAVEVVGFLIPWSLGWISQVDPLLTRTLFWYFGHPVVYFWLLPAYVAWYTVMPTLTDGKLFSDSLARLVFVLFLVLSTPVGFHHQFTDPGISSDFKFVAMVNTMVLLLPSLLTAFTVIASCEYGARQRGGEGWFAWLGSLNWTNPAFASMFLSGIMFAAGGFSGMINAGANINYLIHNTLWVPGHFHLTVGTAVALTFMGMTYWLLPQLTSKSIRPHWLALVQPYLWFIGMFLMSNAMHRGGLAGIPRRSADPTYNNIDFHGVVGGVGEMKLQIAIGGTLLFVSLVCFIGVVLATWIQSPIESLDIRTKLATPYSGSEHSPAILDNMWLWMFVAIVLILLVYGLPLYDLISDGILSPGISPLPPAA